MTKKYKYTKSCGDPRWSTNQNENIFLLMSPIHLYIYIYNYDYNYKIQPIANKVLGEPGV